MDVTITKEIKNMIYTIRGQQVMLDSDLAMLYGYTVKRLNEQVKRNIERFPKDFMFQLTLEEIREISRSQNATLKKNGKGTNVKYAPYVFTEQGIYMLATVLKGEVAISQSIMIIRTFKEMRHYINENKQLMNNSNLLEISSTIIKHEQTIHEIEKSMATKGDIKEVKQDIQNIMNNFILNDRIKEFAFLKGDQFETDELFIKIYKEAKKSIYIIDDYVSIKTLSHLKHKNNNVDVIIFTKNKGGKDKLRKVEIDDFNKKYSKVELRDNNESHDRYIFIDYGTENEKIYHCGASIKDAGKKACFINEIRDCYLVYPLIDRLFV